MSESIYQQRYLAHRERKARELSTPSVSEFPALSRRSRRRFQPGVPLRREHKEALLQAVADAPSSCNRGGVSVLWICDSLWVDEMLVGAASWGRNASATLLFWSDAVCYAHHTLRVGRALADQDAAFAACMAHIKACEIGVASCFICPNMRDHANCKQKDDGLNFCGALAVGYPVLPDLEPPEKRTWEEVLL